MKVILVVLSVGQMVPVLIPFIALATASTYYAFRSAGETALAILLGYGAIKYAEWTAPVMHELWQTLVRNFSA